MDTQAGRELDARIASEVMGQRLHVERNADGSPYWYAIVNPGDPTPTGGWASEESAWLGCRYSTHDPAAVALLHRLNAAGWNVTIRAAGIPPRTHYRVDVTCGRGPCKLHGNQEHDWHGVAGVEADTLALALCRAALLAVGSGRDTKVIL